MTKLSLDDYEFEDEEVKKVFDVYPKAVQAKLLYIRKLIFDVARETKATADIVETLKWGGAKLPLQNRQYLKNRP